MEEYVKLKMSLPQIPDIELVAVEGLERLAKHLGISEEKIGDARILVTEVCDQCAGTFGTEATKSSG